MNVKGQGHSITLVQGHSYSTFSNFFSVETARPIETIFHVEPPWDKSEFKWFMSHDQDGSMPIYGKTFENLLLRNRKADET